ncbi:MAG: prolyl oligopeptidase family serine peptidase [Parvularculaceae bacterium]|nr:prolyl oligopeptidase family serine peptidase [Parvularculaceae bacterium]
MRMVTGAATALWAALSMSAAADPYLWLEEVEGEKAIEWVKARNAESLAVLEADPRFQPMVEEAKAILNSTARIPYGEIHNGKVYNFWQDASHVRGLWRRASIKSYKRGAPEWETVLDFDKLAADEGRNWIHGDIACLSPDYVHCMVELSDGGKDAAFWREFDTSTKSFVDGGFMLGEAKSGVAWIDKDTLLAGTDTGAGSLTASGYPRLTRVWKRGEALAASPAFAEGKDSDVAVWGRVEHDGGIAHVFAQRAVSFFETEYDYAAGPAGEKRTLPLPRNADLQGVLGGRAIFGLREAWTHQGTDYPQGAIVAYDLAGGGAELVMAAAANQSIEDVEIGKSNLVVQYLEDVSGKLARLTRDKRGNWKRKEIAAPENGTLGLVSGGGGTDDALISYESLTTPDSIFWVNGKNKLTKIASAPSYFDASDVIVEQRFATSKDGTKVPFYVMAKKDVLAAGNAPTVQYGYGGFLAATLPTYYADPGRPQHGALAGKMWVSRGGVLVLSNIRGGSEYGPKWHEAALKENRQRSFDDFIAISEHLIETGVTTPQKLGAVGRSNGGLLMGAVLTQRPELYGALDIGVPLLDMERYNKLLAGASWMGEYGDPDKPEEWAYISQYSPYQKLEAGKPYPKVFFYTSTKDDRVHPGHARKAVAKMTALGYPVLYYENIEGGHGGTANQDQLAYRTALEYAYFAHRLMGE